MTVATSPPPVTYLGNGVTTVFTFPFVGVNASDLQVIYVDSNGTSNVLGSSQYTLLFNPVPVGGLWALGGSVTYPTSGSPIQAGTTLTINRIVPYTQTVSIANQGAFYPQAVEQGLDLLELQIQQLAEASTYSLKTPVTDPVPPNVLPGAAARANGYLGFDNNGQPIIVTSAPAPSAPITFAAPRRITNTGTATINILTSDSFGGVSVYQSGSPVTTLQLPAGYGPYPVFDGSLNSITFPLTILPPSGVTILGRTSYTFRTTGGAVTFYNDGAQILIG